MAVMVTTIPHLLSIRQARLCDSHQANETHRLCPSILVKDILDLTRTRLIVEDAALHLIMLLCIIIKFPWGITPRCRMHLTRTTRICLRNKTCTACRSNMIRGTHTSTPRTLCTPACRLPMGRPVPGHSAMYLTTRNSRLCRLSMVTLPILKECRVRLRKCQKDQHQQ